jgi:hypothetical protein
MEPAIAKALLERAGIVFNSEVRIGYGTCTKDGLKNTSDGWRFEIPIWRQSPPEYTGSSTLETFQKRMQVGFTLE